MRYKLISLMLGVILLWSLVLSGCAAKSEYVNLSAADAEELIASGNVVVIDVRELDEFARGHIPEAQLIPLGTLPQELSKLDQNQEYLLVCRSGNRSSQAAALMIENGFMLVNNLRGGMNAWTGPVER